MLSFQEAIEYQYLNYIFVIAVAGCYVYQRVYGLTERHVGWNYNRVLKDWQIWRCYTSTVFHSNILHFALNIFALWTCGSLQVVLGTVSYAKFVLLIFTLNKFLFYPLARFILYKKWPAKFPEDQKESRYSLGLGSLLFGLVGLAVFMCFGVNVDWECERCDQYYLYFGAFDVDSRIGSGFLYLAVALAYIPLNYYLFSKADTVANCTGLFTGFLCGFGTFIWFNSWCALGLFAFLIIVFVGSVLRYSDFGFKTHCFKPADSFPQPILVRSQDSEDYEGERNQRELQAEGLPPSASMSGPTPVIIPSASSAFDPAGEASASGNSNSGAWYKNWFDRSEQKPRIKSDPEIIPEQSSYQPPPFGNHNQRSAFDADPYAESKNNLQNTQRPSAWDP